MPWRHLRCRHQRAAVADAAAAEAAPPQSLTRRDAAQLATSENVFQQPTGGLASRPYGGRQAHRPGQVERPAQRRVEAPLQQGAALHQGLAAALLLVTASPKTPAAGESEATPGTPGGGRGSAMPPVSAALTPPERLPVATPPCRSPSPAAGSRRQQPSPLVAAGCLGGFSASPALTPPLPWLPLWAPPPLRASSNRRPQRRWCAGWTGASASPRQELQHLTMGLMLQRC